MIRGSLKLGAMLVVLATTSVAAGEEPLLSIATFNINYANIDLARVTAAIVESDADIVLLQETNLQSENYLRRRLGQRYSTIRFAGHEGIYYAERFGVLSRFPVRNLKFTPPNAGLFGSMSGTVQWDQADFRFINVHLTPFTVPRNAGFSGMMQAVSRVELRHKKEIEALMLRLKPEMPTIVAGDFNSISTFVAPKMLQKNGLLDSFGQVSTNPDAQPTWKWPIREPRVQLRIDYIFHSNHWLTVKSRIIPCPASDHSLVVSKLRKRSHQAGAPPDENRTELHRQKSSRKQIRRQETPSTTGNFRQMGVYATSEMSSRWWRALRVLAQCPKLRSMARSGV